MSDETHTEAMWRGMLTGQTSPIRHDRNQYRRIPGKPRCKTCLVPFGGPAAPLVRLVIKRRPSEMNPNYCNMCETFIRTHPGGAEIELSLVFADVRGSTGLAERMGAMAFTKLLNRFYHAANRVLIDSDGLVDKLVGDEVIGLYLPFIGEEHPRKAILAARDLLVATGHEDPGGPWVPVGAGVHTGMAYVGAVGSQETVTDFTALGDAVNTTARLSAVAAAGEVLVSDDAYTRSDLDLGELEQRNLELRGRSMPLAVRVLRVGRSRAAA